MQGPARFDLGNQILSHDEQREIAIQLRAGAIIIYPTDTLYAIGCLASNAGAIERLRAAKGREEDKALPVIAADLSQARALASTWPDLARMLAEDFWPGPLTVVVPAALDLPEPLLVGSSGIAVRVPASDAARLLARLAGPLVSTSANRAGQPPCTSVQLAMAAFPAATLVFDVGQLDGAPSTIVDLTHPAPAWRILRAGPVSSESIASSISDRMPR